MLCKLRAFTRIYWPAVWKSNGWLTPLGVNSRLEFAGLFAIACESCASSAPFGASWCIREDHPFPVVWPKPLCNCPLTIAPDWQQSGITTFRWFCCFESQTPYVRAAASVSAETAPAGLRLIGGKPLGFPTECVSLQGERPLDVRAQGCATSRPRSFSSDVRLKAEQERSLISTQRIAKQSVINNNQILAAETDQPLGWFRNHGHLVVGQTPKTPQPIRKVGCTSSA